MKTINNIKAVSLIVIICFFSCGKKAIKIDKRYIGVWAVEGSGSLPTGCPGINIIEINDHDEGSAYTIGGERECNKGDRKTGVTRVRSGFLHIGVRYAVQIDQPPTDIDSTNIQTINTAHPEKYTCKMILGGKTFYRGK